MTSSNDGTLQFIPAEAQVAKMEQFNKEYRYAAKSQQHLWVAVQSHVISKAALKDSGADPMLLDNESLRQVGIGCFICESGYEPRELDRKCKGEPR